AYMAGVVGRLTGKPGVCLATLGPGATNLTTGIADANLDHAPLVAFTGQAARKRIHKESKQIIDVISHFRPITKWNAQIERGELIPEMVRKAFKLAQVEKPGACHLELPSDVAEEEVESQRPLPIQRITYPCSDGGALKEAARLINECKYPIILAGNGVIRGRASEALREFVRHTQIPVAHTFMAMGCIPGDDELCLLSVGLQQHDVVNCGFDRADLVIGIGYDFPEYGPEEWNPKGDKKIINIDFVSSEVDFHYCPTVELLGDIGESLTLLKGLAKKKSLAPVKNLKSYILSEIEEYTTDESFPIKPQRVIQEVRKALGREDILVSDTGAHMIWVARNYMAQEPLTTLITFGFASMGFGIPAAIVSKLIHPEKKVVAIVGDGSFLMTSMELETASRLGTNFVTIIFRDDGYGLIKWKQLHKFGVEYGSTFKNPDFVQYARAFGMEGYRVERPSELLPILQKALKEDIPCIIDVPIDFEENLRLSKKLGELICPV
ncbi:MAG TPA: acetolactate synthase large subunit, partial [Candidatus Hypogeohydataceae bacterium YC40]